MSKELLNLKAIDDLIAHLEHKGESETTRILNAVREHYNSDRDLATRQSIPSRKLLQAAVGDREVPESYLASLKTVVNATLEKLFRQKLTPFHLNVGPNNTFALSGAAGTPENPGARTTTVTADRAGFKSSEMTFNLPKEIHEQFLTHLKNVKEQEREVNTKLEALLDSKTSLLQEKAALEEEKENFRTETLIQVENLQQSYDENKKLFQEEISRLKTETARIQKDYKNSLNRQKYDSDLLVKIKQKHEKDLADNKNQFMKQFHGLTDLLASVTRSEEDFLQRKSRNIEKIKTREKELEKISESQINKQKELDAQARQLTIAKKNYRAQIENEFKKQAEEYKQNFYRRSEYHRRRSDEEKAELKRFEAEKTQLQEREALLEQTVRNRTRIETKQRQKELDKLEKEFIEKHRLLAKAEFALSKEKHAIIQNTPDNDEGGMTQIAKLNALVKNQEDVLRQKTRLLESLANDRADHQKIMAEQMRDIEKGKKEAIPPHKKETHAYMEAFENLKDREKELTVRETEELQRLNDEYDALRLSLAAAGIGKRADLDDFSDQIYNEELALREKQERLFANEKKSAEIIRNREQEVLEKLSEIQAVKSRTMEFQKEMMAFLTDFRKTYGHKLEKQNSEYESFQRRLQEIETDSMQFSQMIQANEKRDMEVSSNLQKSLEKRLREKIAIVEKIGKEQKDKVLEYQNYIKENRGINRKERLDEKNQQDLILKNLINHEKKLYEIGEAFEELSGSFRQEIERQNVFIIPEETQPSMEYNEDFAKMEWTQAIKQRLENNQSKQNLDMERFRFILADKWGEWISIPAGEFQMGRKNSRESAPHKRVTIEKSFRIKKYPVTNVEFFHFVHETNYKSEAENGVTAIVYCPGSIAAGSLTGLSSKEEFAWPAFVPDDKAFWLCPQGRPDFLNDKFSHPVTQVTWNDALAYCQWKSEVTGCAVRLPNEIEWEYAASSLGMLPAGTFHWDKKEIIRHCNIEETQIFGTAPVDHFPYCDLMAGVQDMFGNVHEWVMDSVYRQSESGEASEYKIARGGSYVNAAREISQWRRFLFPLQRCTAYIGFRVVCEEE